MKIRMNVEDVALTMAKQSQIEQRLQTILDGKRGRHSAGRATIVSALLLTASAIPLLAAAQTRSDSAVQAQADKTQLQIHFLVAGQPMWLITSTSGSVTSAMAKSPGSTSRIDINVPDGQMVFLAKTIRMAGNKFVLNGNVVISVRDKSGKDTSLFQAESATLVGIAAPNKNRNAKIEFSAKKITAGKDKLVLNDHVALTWRDKKDPSKIFYQFKADTATVQVPPQSRR